MLCLTATIVVGPALLMMFEALVRANRNQALDDLVESKEKQAAFRALAKALAEEPDEKYWNDLANFVKQINPTTADLVLMLQFVMMLNPLGTSDEFAWNSWSDEVAEVKKLESIYGKGGSEGKVAVLKQLGAIIYEGLPLPRCISASLGQQAFAHALAKAGATS